MAKEQTSVWSWGGRAQNLWLPCAMIALTGCGGGGITVAPEPSTEQEWTVETTAMPSEDVEIDPAVAPYTFDEAPAAAGSGAIGPIFAGRTWEGDRSYRVGDWLNRDAKRELRSVEVVDDPNRSYQCQVVSGLGVGTYNSEVRVHVWFRPGFRGKHSAKLKFTWASVPNGGTPVVKSGKVSISGFAAKLQVDGFTSPGQSAISGGGKRASFLPNDTLGVKLSAFPSNGGAKLPDRSLNIEWSYVDGSERRLTSGWTSSVSDARLTKLSGGIAKNDATFAARRGREFTSGSNVANPAIGIRMRATLTLAGVSESVEVSPREDGPGYAFVQDATDRLRQEYWDFNQNPQRRAANYRAKDGRWTYVGDRVDYVVPERKDIGVGQSVYGVEVVRNRNRFDASLAALRSKANGANVVNRYRNPRAELAAMDAVDPSGQIHPLGALPYSARIYGNSYDVPNTPGVMDACAALGWSNRTPERTGGRATYVAAPGNLVTIGF